ncbi:MAG: caspase family protein [Bacteroidota bacterium]|nr:caspase family protein [Bacteroidota bacterium]
MRHFILLLSFLFSNSLIFSQLKDIKIIIPKEIGFSYYDFVQFFPNEKFFAVCGNALSIINTETSEVIDEYDLTYGAKNLSISPDGNSILLTINNDLYVFSFINQKISFQYKITTSDLIKGLPNSQYYSSLPIGGCFFTGKTNEIYASIGSFTLKYDLEKKVAISSHAFPLTDYIIHSSYFIKKHEVILAKTSGTISTIMRQSLDDLSKTSDLITDAATPTKIKVRDSLVFCFTSNKYFILNLETGKIVHEVRMPKYDNYGLYDKKLLNDINKRPSITKPDTINFSKDEYVYDIDYLTRSGLAVYATLKGIKFIDLKTKKLVRQHKGITLNVKLSSEGNRMISNSYTPYRALRVYDPNDMKMISERPSMGNSIYSAHISPNKRWLYTNGTSSGFFWDMKNFSKYTELKDISGSDSAYISNVFFLNDSEVVVNSGKTFQNLNLTIYNINKKKYGKTIKKNVYSISSGFLNGEFYYADYTSLHIVNLKTLQEEKYEGMYSLAASPLYKIINFSKNLVFVPESGKYKIVNRKTKKVEYESTSWSVNAKVEISPDEKSVYTASQIMKKKNINGYDVDMQTNAIVKIDMVKKEIVTDYAQTFYPYDFRIKNNGKVIGIWYVKYDVGAGYTEGYETMYTEYDTETGKELYSKTIIKTKDIVSFHATSESGKYFTMHNPFGEFFKVFNEKGDSIIDLKDLKISMPNCFFIEDQNKMIVTSSINSLATFVDLNKKQIIGQLANAKDDNFFLITSDLHYLGSKEFIKSIRFKYQSEIFSFEQFDAYLNQPHKVLRAFGCSDSALIQAYETAYLKRMRVLGFKPDNKINFAVLPTFQTIKMTEEKPGFVKFSLSANKGQGKLSKLEVHNNGTQIFSEAITTEENSRFDKTLTFETSSGINRFEFILKDESGLESPRLTRYFNNTSTVKSDLYLLVIASEKFKNDKYDLAYAVKDATDMANNMSNSKSFNTIKIKKLFNQSFTTDSVKNLNNFFGKAGVNDVVMVFYAGHGYLDNDMSYYFPTYYTDFSDPKINAVAYKSFEKIFKEMKPLKKLMFIDACFSGEVDEEELYNDPTDKNKTKKDSSRAVRLSGSTFAQSTALEMSKAVFSDLRQNSGATIISSAGGTEAAFEGEKWNNGLFTYCLLNGMKNFKADQNGDRKITLNELQKFVSEEVYKLSDGKQSPTYRMENTVLDYELW